MQPAKWKPPEQVCFGMPGGSQNHSRLGATCHSGEEIPLVAFEKGQAQLPQQKSQREMTVVTSRASSKA